MGFSYADAGVDIEKGDRFANFIGSIQSKAVSKGIGGFAGGVEIDTERFKKPVLLSTTDGVGTKLLVGQKLNKLDTLGIDLVAMCVNDLIVCGAEPMVFLDYIACGGINEELLQEVMKGIVTGCEQAECTLSGGETAEMPDLYGKDDFDLAGFSVGIVDKEQMLPAADAIKPGDPVYGLPSVGIHSNGLSLARKVLKDSDHFPSLLTPTKIYVKELKQIFTTGAVSGAAHITGGGLHANLQRVLPEGITSKLTWDWDIPEIFTQIQNTGSVDQQEMRKVFNMGIGIAMTVRPENSGDLETFCETNGINLVKIGELISG